MLEGWRTLTPWRRSICQRNSWGPLTVLTNPTLLLWSSPIKALKVQKLRKSKKPLPWFLTLKKYYYTTTTRISLLSLSRPVNIWIWAGNPTGRKSTNTSTHSSILKRACTRTTMLKSKNKSSRSGGKAISFIASEHYGTKLFSPPISIR